MLTSPADRGVEILFPLGRLIKDFHLDYDGIIKNKNGLLWYIEDPIRIIKITSDKDLIPSFTKSPWIRVYGPFKNSRIADWTIFYSSIIFLVLFNIDDLQKFVIQLTSSVILHYPLIFGITLFYSGGEIWRRKFQRSGKYRSIIALVMIIGVAFLLYGIVISIHVLAFSEYSLKLGVTSLISTMLGFVLAYIHVIKRHKLAIM
ncbi:metal-dependent hydrolase [Acidianus ambivalens]|uniref:metal-dependent hydrolase n=1 Tax=Acidianus ambivalens TaxID=2283 RepID=UPI001E4401D3|nr:metal-dependent hydrolase [Acidianus ambivalens]